MVRKIFEKIKMKLKNPPCLEDLKDPSIIKSNKRFREGKDPTIILPMMVLLAISYIIAHGLILHGAILYGFNEEAFNRALEQYDPLSAVVITFVIWLVILATIWAARKL